MALKRRELTLAIKEQIICLSNKGRKNVEIAKITGYNPSTISKFLKRFTVRKFSGKQHSKWTTKIDKCSIRLFVKQVGFERS